MIRPAVGRRVLAMGSRVSAPRRSDANGPSDAAPVRGPSRRARDVALSVLSLLLFAGVLYAVWEAVSLLALVPDIILPAPIEVAQGFGNELANGDLAANTATTLQEALGGFALAALVAGTLGYFIAHVRWLEVLAAPAIAASQAVPAVAVAPILITLFGFGLLPKVLVCAVVVVFPLLINTVTGLRSIERDYHDVARVFGASRLQTLRHLELPLAAPALLGGLKLGLSLAIVGAVVGEFVAADSGLGFMINTSIGNFDNAVRYVALITLALLSIGLFGLVTLLERIILRWQEA
jgi:NitT/TauT family transport system permease protein